ncbi:hypothetical protein GCM10025874_08770 [Arenivirga flava]|uniref:Uncharacterized protein n=1 Tax=Arenivirga flava TaxID=1930060 RepID=A0AA37UBS8_9MICO|nr:hypothetical protein GCM10025874_08770 [Arenivirga flava]
MIASSARGWFVRTVRSSASTAPAGCARENRRGSRARNVERLEVCRSVTVSPPGLRRRMRPVSETLAPAGSAPSRVRSGRDQMLMLRRSDQAAAARDSRMRAVCLTTSSSFSRSRVYVGAAMKIVE